MPTHPPVITPRLHNAVPLIIVAIIIFLTSNIASAQTYTWNGTLEDNRWDDPTNWLVGNATATEFPDAIGIGTDFIHNSGTNLVVAMDNTTVTIGSITASGNRSVFIGNFTSPLGLLDLDNGVNGAPVFTVNLSGGMDLQVRTQMQGENGFIKNGAGTLFSRQINHSGLNGTITIAEGTLVIGQGGSLGNESNTVEFTGNATLTSCPSTLESDVIVHSAARTFTVSSGAVGTFSSLVRNFESSANRTITTAFEGNLTGDGGFNFVKGFGGDSYFLLNGTNTYTGDTGIQGRATVILGEGSNISQGALIFSGAGGLLDLGGNNQTVSNLSTALGSTNCNATVTNGSLSISGSQDVLLGGANSGGLIDLSGLSSFSRNSTSGNFSFRTGTQSSNINTVSLVRNGTNLIAAETFTVGGANQTSNTTRTTNLQLGQTNTFRASTMFFGSTGGTANVTFQSGLVNPTLEIRGSDGASAVGNLTIGYNSGTGGTGGADVNLHGGILDAEVVNLYVGRFDEGTSLTQNSTLRISAGSLNASSIVLASKAGAGNQTLNSAIIQTGGEVRTSSLVLGEGGSENPTLNASYTISGGNLTASSISVGSGNSSSTSTRTLNISGNGTLQNQSGSDLNITGQQSALRGRAVVAVSENATMNSSNGDIVFGANSTLSGGGMLSKTGNGNLVFNSSSTNHTFNGTLAVLSGNLILNSNLTNATIRIDSGSMNGNSTISNLILNQDLTLGAGSTLIVNSSLSGSSNLSKTGAGHLTIWNTSAFSGNLSVNGGGLYLESSSSTPTSVQSATLGGNGTLSNVSFAGAVNSFDVTANRSLTISSPVAGSVDFIKTGSGNLTLSDANGHTGNFSVNAGGLFYTSNSNANISVNSATLGGNATLQNVSLSGSSAIHVATGESLAISSNITGTSGFTKNGSGMLSLAAGTTSGLSGPITINAGRLDTLSNLSSNITLGNATLAGSASLANLSVSTGASANLDSALGQTLSITSGGALTGRGNFTKTGAGDLAIGGSGNHTYNGTANISAGTLVLSGNLSRSNLVFSGGNLNGTSAATIGNVTLSQNSAFNLSSDLTINASLTGSGNLAKSGIGNLTLATATGYGGAIDVTGGGLYINSNATAPVSLAASTLGGNGVLQSVSSTGASTFDIAASRSLTINSSLTGSGSFMKTGAGNLTIADASGYSGTANATAGGIFFNGNFNQAGQSLALSNATLGGNSTIHTLAIQGNSTVNTSQNITISSALTGSSQLTKNGTGSLVLNADAATSFTGPISVNQGRLETLSNLSSNITLGNATLAGNAILSGNISVTGNGSVFDTAASQTLSINGATARLSGNRTFSKTGSGTLSVQAAGNHTYSGSAIIQAGSLIISSGANMTASTITVNGSSAILGGGGRLGSMVLTNGTIAPSAGSETGALTTLNAANLTWNGGIITMNLGGVGNLTASDRISLSGTFTKGTGTNFVFDFNGTGAEGGNYTLLTFTSNSTFQSSDFSITNIAPGLGSSFTMNSTSLVLNVVPEPGTWALLLASVILLAAKSGKARLRLSELFQSGKKLRLFTAGKPPNGGTG